MRARDVHMGVWQNFLDQRHALLEERVKALEEKIKTLSTAKTEKETETAQDQRDC